LVDADTEKDSYLYTTRLNLHWSHTASIDKSVVVEIAEEHNLTIDEVLSEA
jgi:hypothetical protein